MPIGKRKDLKIEKYAAFRLLLGVKDPDTGALIDYAAGTYKARMEIRDNAGALVLGIDDGATVGVSRVEFLTLAPGDTFNVRVTIPDTITATLAEANDHTYDLLIRPEPTTGEDIERILEGDVRVVPGTTTGVP